MAVLVGTMDFSPVVDLCFKTARTAVGLRGGATARHRRLSNDSKERKTTDHKIGTRAEWLAARERLLVREKEHTRLGDELAWQRRDLPWVRVEKDYRFDTDDVQHLGARRRRLPHLGGGTTHDLTPPRNNVSAVFLPHPHTKQLCEQNVVLDKIVEPTEPVLERRPPAQS
jgi:Bacterial protein of unknown function (DUF899)